MLPTVREKETLTRREDKAGAPPKACEDEEQPLANQDDPMSASLVSNAAWYRDAEGRTGYKDKEWEESPRMQKDQVKMKKKRSTDGEPKLEKIDDELIGEKKPEEEMNEEEEATPMITDKKMEKKLEKERKEKEEKERKEKEKGEKEAKKREKEQKKQEDKERKEEEKRGKDRFKRSESPKSPKVEKAEKEMERKAKEEKEKREKGDKDKKDKGNKDNENHTDKLIEKTKVKEKSKTEEKENADRKMGRGKEKERARAEKFQEEKNGPEKSDAEKKSPERKTSSPKESDKKESVKKSSERKDSDKRTPEKKLSEKKDTENKTPEKRDPEKPESLRKDSEKGELNKKINSSPGREKKSSKTISSRINEKPLKAAQVEKKRKTSSTEVKVLSPSLSDRLSSGISSVPGFNDRRDSSQSESSRVSFQSHKSVTFCDRITVNEIERMSRNSTSDEDDYAVMSDNEMSNLRKTEEKRNIKPSRPRANAGTEAAIMRQGEPSSNFENEMFFDESSPHEHYPAEDFGSELLGSDNYVDLDSLPLSVRQAIESEMSSRFAALYSGFRQDSGGGGGSMTRLHDSFDTPHSGGSLASQLSLPRSASGYFDDPMRDSYQQAMANQNALYFQRAQAEDDERRRRAREEAEFTARVAAQDQVNKARQDEFMRQQVLLQQQQSEQELELQRLQATQAAAEARMKARSAAKALAEQEAIRKVFNSPTTPDAMQSSFYDNVTRNSAGEGSTHVAGQPSVRSPTNSEITAYAPKQRQQVPLLVTAEPVNREPLTNVPVTTVSMVQDPLSTNASSAPRKSSLEQRSAFFSTMTMPVPEKVKIGVFSESSTPSQDSEKAPELTEQEERMRRRFVARFGAGRKAPIAGDEMKRRESDAESAISTDSRESVVSAASTRAENAVLRHFTY